MVVMAAECALYCPMFVHTQRNVNPVSPQQCDPWASNSCCEEATGPCLPDPFLKVQGGNQVGL